MAVIGFSESHLYCNGTLCYLIDETIRILNLHESARHEVVIDITGLLRNALSTHRYIHKGRFRLLYYESDVVSCHYKITGPVSTDWLLAFDVAASKLLVAQELEVSEKLFVRHTEKYLYYGTHSAVNSDGLKRWVLHGCKLGERGQETRWFDDRLHLRDMVGSIIGHDICFKVHNGYFYALSNRTAERVEDVDWISYYHCWRFPLESPSQLLLERSLDILFMRKQHSEGPIDDRWTTLSLEVNERTGNLQIVESRHEWIKVSSTSQRAYYIKEVLFPEDSSHLSLRTTRSVFSETPAIDTILCSEIGTVQHEQRLNDLFNASDTHGTASQMELDPSPTILTSSDDADIQGVFSPIASTASVKYPLKQKKIVMPSLFSTSSCPLAHLTRDRPTSTLYADYSQHHLPPQSLLSSQVHQIDSEMTYLFSDVYKSSYDSGASTYLDLVNICYSKEQQQICLRVGCRKPLPPLHIGELSKRKTAQETEELGHNSAEIHSRNHISFRPPVQTDEESSKVELADLNSLLNPPSHIGNVEATIDERSIVYVTGDKDKPQALIFISFDPTIRLEGLTQWKMRNYDSSGEDARTPVQENDDVGNVGRVMLESHASGVIQSWIWREQPMFRAINRGYHFGLQKKSSGLHQSESV